MDKADYGLIEEIAPGAEKMDRSWMLNFWEIFCDTIIVTDAQFNFTNIIRKADSTFTITGIIGKSFLDIAVDKDREYAAQELEMFRSAELLYRRFTFMAKNGRYYRWTLAPVLKDGVFDGVHGMSMDATEQSLKETTLNWQRAVIEGSRDFISIANADGKVLYTNPGAYKMTGYNQGPGELALDRIFDPGHLQTVRGEGLEKTIEKGYWTSPNELICKDGTRIPIEHIMFSVDNKQDQSILIATIIRDITDYIEHEKTMRNEQRRTELLASTAMSFSLSDDFDANMNEGLSSIGSFMGVDAMYIYRADPNKGCFICDYIWSDNPAYTAPAGREVQFYDYDTSEYAGEYTLLQSVPIFSTSDFSTLDGNLFTKARAAGAKSMVCLPVHVDDRFWGFIGLVMYTACREWTDRDLRFLKTVCGILSTSLEKRLMSQRWMAAQADLQAVVRNYPGVIWSVDLSRRFTLYDGAFINASDERTPDIIGRNMHEFAGKNPDKLHPSLPEKVERTFMGEPQDWMIELENAAFRCNTMPITGVNGQITGVVGASVDVTGMIQMQKDLEIARKAAEAANLAKSEFLSRMSHEIRTPMNAIIGMTQIARNSADEERIRSCLGKIDTASRHLLALINDILDISKIEANKLELQNETFDLGKCVSGIRAMIMVRVEERKQSFILNFSDSLPKFLVGDELRFTQVIINLLGNAVKFTPEEGTISLDVEEKLREKNECVLEVRVRDSGIGITPEHLRKLFTPFEQGDGSITREYGGTGLGLAICKYIVEMMGGEIRVESERGKGSVFTFTARMSIGNEKPGVDSTPAKKLKYGADFISVNDLGRFTVLLVEDVEINREIVYSMLEDTRLNIETAENGEKAVEKFLASPGKYSLILMDMQMPVMDGLEATRRIRDAEAKLRMESASAQTPGSKQGKIVPIVAMTANVFKEDVAKCREAGMNDHIAKPIDSGLLLEKIIHYLLIDQ